MEADLAAAIAEAYEAFAGYASPGSQFCGFCYMPEEIRRITTTPLRHLDAEDCRRLLWEAWDHWESSEVYRHFEESFFFRSVAAQGSLERLAVWLITNSMGRDLDSPLVQLGYQLDHLHNDCDRPQDVVEHLKAALPKLMPPAPPRGDDVMVLLAEREVR